MNEVETSQTASEELTVKLRVKPQVGDTVGKYELLEEVGAGAMGVVFKARDVALDRLVAIKFLLLNGAASVEFLERFKQEARVLGQLEHPNIVKVHEVIATTDGAPYIVMNYLSGATLADGLTREGKLSIGRWLSIMIQACTALEHAHANGIIHRDIKPSNFILAEENKSETLKLIDFGVAKNTSDEQGLTKSGDVFGTPLYMSPEQCAGEKLDERSDIYSLGCVMYEALSGKRPLVGENSLSTMQKHLRDIPESLSTLVNDANVIDGVRNIDHIVMKCLQKKPEDRYQKVSEVKEDLQALLQGEKPALRLTYNSKNKRIIASVMIGLASGLTLLIGFQLYYQHHTSKPSLNKVEKVSHKTEPEPDATDDPVLAEKRRRVIDLMKEGRRVLIEGKNWTAAREYDRKALPIALEIGKPAILAQIYWRLGHYEEHFTNFNDAKKFYHLTLKMVSNRSSNDFKDWQYQALAGLGRIAAGTQDFEKAIVYYGQAYKAIQTRQPNVLDPETEAKTTQKHRAICLYGIGTVYQMEGQLQQAEIYFRAVLKIQPDHIDAQKKLKQLSAMRQSPRPGPVQRRRANAPASSAANSADASARSTSILHRSTSDTPQI